MKELGYVIAALALLALLYFGTYYAMLLPPSWRSLNADGTLKPDYRFGGAAADAFYEPAFALDRQIRPERWPAPFWALPPKGDHAP